MPKTIILGEAVYINHQILEMELNGTVCFGGLARDPPAERVPCAPIGPRKAGVSRKMGLFGGGQLFSFFRSGNLVWDMYLLDLLLNAFLAFHCFSMISPAFSCLFVLAFIASLWLLLLFLLFLLLLLCLSLLPYNFSSCRSCLSCFFCACLALPGFSPVFFTFLLLVLLWRIVSLFELLVLSMAFVAVAFWCIPAFLAFDTPGDPPSI